LRLLRQVSLREDEVVIVLLARRLAGRLGLDAGVRR
jgi:hypothetical protein